MLRTADTGRNANRNRGARTARRRLPTLLMAPVDAAQIPNRSLFRQPEVCEIAQVQPYVLRSWEAEFKDLGVAKTVGGPRVYRRTDVERVLRIKHLLFVEGLTLGGVREAARRAAGRRCGNHRTRRARRAARERRARAHPAGEAGAPRDCDDAGQGTGGGLRRGAGAVRLGAAEDGEAQHEEEALKDVCAGARVP